MYPIRPSHYPQNTFVRFASKQQPDKRERPWGDDDTPDPLKLAILEIFSPEKLLAFLQEELAKSASSTSTRPSVLLRGILPLLKGSLPSEQIRQALASHVPETYLDRLLPSSQVNDILPATVPERINHIEQFKNDKTQPVYDVLSRWLMQGLQALDERGKLNAGHLTVAASLVTDFLRERYALALSQGTINLMWRLTGADTGGRYLEKFHKGSESAVSATLTKRSRSAQKDQMVRNVLLNRIRFYTYAHQGGGSKIPPLRINIAKLRNEEPDFKDTPYISLQVAVRSLVRDGILIDWHNERDEKGWEVTPQLPMPSETDRILYADYKRYLTLSKKAHAGQAQELTLHEKEELGLLKAWLLENHWIYSPPETAEEALATLEQYLSRQIAQGKLKIGSKIDSAEHLSEQLQIPLELCLNSLRSLSSTGRQVLLSYPGAGTFLLKHPDPDKADQVLAEKILEAHGFLGFPTSGLSPTSERARVKLLYHLKAAVDRSEGLDASTGIKAEVNGKGIPAQELLKAVGLTSQEANRVLEDLQEKRLLKIMLTEGPNGRNQKQIQLLADPRKFNGAVKKTR